MSRHEEFKNIAEKYSRELENAYAKGKLDTYLMIDERINDLHKLDKYQEDDYHKGFNKKTYVLLDDVLQLMREVIME